LRQFQSSLAYATQVGLAKVEYQAAQVRVFLPGNFVEEEWDPGRLRFDETVIGCEEGRYSFVVLNFPSSIRFSGL